MSFFFLLGPIWNQNATSFPFASARMTQEHGEGAREISGCILSYYFRGHKSIVELGPQSLRLHVPQIWEVKLRCNSSVLLWFEGLSFSSALRVLETRVGTSRQESISFRHQWLLVIVTRKKSKECLYFAYSMNRAHNSAEARFLRFHVNSLITYINI